MNSTALTMMLVTEIAVTVITIYYFVKVLRTPPKQEPDSFTDNDDEKR
jgi:hypothetical protein